MRPGSGTASGTRFGGTGGGGEEIKDLRRDPAKHRAPAPLNADPVKTSVLPQPVDPKERQASRIARSVGR